MKNANKRLIISIAALVISIALAATTTFAWFTMDTTPEINDIDLSVTVQDGLYISQTNNDGDFYTNVTVGQVGNLFLDAVTLKGAANLTAADAFVKIADGTTVGTANATANTDFYKQTFYIRSQSQYNINVRNVTITGGDTTAIQNIDAWKNITAADLGLTGDAWDDTLFPAAKSAEGVALTAPVAALEADDILVPQGEELPVPAVIKNAIRIGFAASNVMVKVYEPNKGNGWDAYLPDSYNAAHDYFKTVTAMSASDITTFDSTWATPTYSAILFDQTKLSSAAGFTTDNLILGSYDSGNPVGGLTAPIADGWYTAAIDVYIWAEGCDPDCFNELLKDSISISIEFGGDYVANT